MFAFCLICVGRCKNIEEVIMVLTIIRLKVIPLVTKYIFSPPKTVYGLNLAE